METSTSNASEHRFSRARWPLALRRWWAAHPRVGLALRTSIAGGLAWLIAQLLPSSEADQYAYFAPMGAVIVTSMSVAGTIRELLRSLGAVTLGAALGLAAVGVMQPTAVSIAIVIAVSVLVAGWSRLGSMRGWVPTVAIFTLVLGGGSRPWAYATAYIGLSALGAAIGAAVVALLPQLIVEPLDAAVRRLWSMTVDRLRQVRDELGRGRIQPVNGNDLDFAIQQVSNQLSHAEDVARINRRRRKVDLDGRHAYARSVRLLAQRLEDFRRRLLQHQSDERSSVDGDLGQLLGEAVGLIVQTMEQRSNDELDAQLDAALTRVDEAVHRVPDGAPGLHTASASVLELRQLALAARDAVERSRQWM